MRKTWIFELEKGEKGGDERRNEKMTEKNKFFMKEVSERKEKKILKNRFPLKQKKTDYSKKIF